MNGEATARIVQLTAYLSSISNVTFRSRSGAGSRCGWSGEGSGTVTVALHDDGSLTFTENGLFRLDAHPADSDILSPRPMAFHNVFRWHLGEERIALSHERRGPDAAVRLFDLVIADREQEADFVSREAHLCGDDRYRARLTLLDQGFDLVWSIQGPRKNEQLHYHYR